MNRPILTHLRELERLIIALSALNGLLAEIGKGPDGLPTIIGILVDQMQRELNNTLATIPSGGSNF